MSPRIVFEQELKALKESVTTMSLLVENTYDELFQALEDKDENKIRKIMESDRTVSDMERNIESRCLSLLTRQQPVARDLRTVSASLKVVTDIKRVGDIISDIAELLLRLNMTELSSYSVHLPAMMRSTKAMLREAVESFVERNEREARIVIDEDDIVDEFFNKVKEDLIGYLKKETKNADDCIDILMIAKYFEKIGDHAVNIAEWELFQETGDIGNTRIL